MSGIELWRLIPLDVLQYLFDTTEIQGSDLLNFMRTCKFFKSIIEARDYRILRRRCELEAVQKARVDEVPKTKLRAYYFALCKTNMWLVYPKLQRIYIPHIVSVVGDDRNTFALKSSGDLTRLIWSENERKVSDQNISVAKDIVSLSHYNGLFAVVNSHGLVGSWGENGYNATGHRYDNQTGFSRNQRNVKSDSIADWHIKFHNPKQVLVGSCFIAVLDQAGILHFTGRMIGTTEIGGGKLRPLWDILQHKLPIKKISVFAREICFLDELNDVYRYNKWERHDAEWNLVASNVQGIWQTNSSVIVKTNEETYLEVGDDATGPLEGGFNGIKKIISLGTFSTAIIDLRGQLWLRIFEYSPFCAVFDIPADEHFHHYYTPRPVQNVQSLKGFVAIFM